MKREVKVGLFFTGACIILAIFLFSIGNLSNLFRRSGYPIIVRFDSALGLDKTAAVRMAGIKIGYVKDIQLEDIRARVVLNIYPKYKIPRGSKVGQATLGLLGEKYLQIEPSHATVYCSANDELEVGPSTSLDLMAPMLSKLSLELDQVATSLQEVINPANRENLSIVLENAAGFSAELRKFMNENRSRFDQTIVSAASVTRTLDLKLKDISQNVDSTLKEIRSITDDNKNDLREIITGLKQLVKDLEETAAVLKRGLEKIDRGEGTAGKIINDPRLYDETRETINSFKKISETAQEMKFHLDMRGDYLSVTDKFRGTISMSLWKGRRQFLLGQIVNRPQDSRFVYSLEAGFRWHNFSPRAGIIESRFGVGLDYYGWQDRFVLSLEGSDFNRVRSPMFRSMIKYYPLKNIYLVIGLEDFTLAAKRQTFFGLGAGF